MNQSILETYKQHSRKYFFQILGAMLALLAVVLVMLFLNHNTIEENLITIYMFVHIIVFMLLLVFGIKYFKDKKSTAVLKNMSDSERNRIENDFKSGLKVDCCTLAGDYFVVTAPNAFAVLNLADYTNLHVQKVRHMLLFIPIGTDYFFIFENKANKRKPIRIQKKSLPQYEQMMAEIHRRFPDITLGC